MDDAPRCSHGAVSPCCKGQDAPTQLATGRVRPTADGAATGQDVCEMAFNQALQLT